MPTELIRLGDDLLVEVEVDSQESRQVSGGSAERVAKSFSQIQAVLSTVCKPLKSTWQELNKEMTVEKAEVEIGLGFEGEGNLFVTKAKAGANLTVKLTLTDPKKEGV